MTYSLADVKKDLKNTKFEGDIIIHLEEFGVGFDCHLQANCSYQLGEEETRGKAEARGKRIAESLTKQGYKVFYLGVCVDEVPEKKF